MISKTFLIVIPLLVAILARITPSKYCIKPFNTLTHELAHAIVALVLGSKVKEININPDFSGSCVNIRTNFFKQFLISIAGYTTPSLLGYLLIKFMNDTADVNLFYCIIIINLIALIFYIRNTFGVIWTLLFTLLNFCFAYFSMFQAYYAYISYTYACILLMETFLDTIVLLKLNLESAKKAGDAYNLQKSTHIPALVYSLLFFAFSCFMIYKVCQVIIATF